MFEKITKAIMIMLLVVYILCIQSLKYEEKVCLNPQNPLHCTAFRFTTDSGCWPQGFVG